MQLATIMAQNLSYNADGKAKFHAEGRKALKRVAAKLGLLPSTFDIRSNQGGIAVSGEVTLHSDHLYIQLYQSCMGPGYEILYRTCKGRKDYTGGPNNQAPIDYLEQNFFIAKLKSMIPTAS